MGRGLVYRCPNCGKEYHVLVGSGFVFPEVYRETLLRVLNGEYGVRLQNEIKTSPFAAIDAEYHLYVCRCGWWETDFGLSVFQPKNTEEILNTHYGERTVRELGYVPYVTGCDLKEMYRIKYRYYHYCGVCHKRMNRQTIYTDMKMCCKECGEILEETEDCIQWD